MTDEQQRYMKIDWSTAKVEPARSGTNLVLNVRVDVPASSTAHHDLFDSKSRAASLEQVGLRRHVARVSSGGGQWSLSVSPIDADDIDGEKAWLEKFVAELDAEAGPRYEQERADWQTKRDEREAAEAKAAELTERFREEPSPPPDAA